MDANSNTNAMSRRRFLKSGALAGAGLAFGAPSILSATARQAPSDQIKVAFIGCGAQQQVLFNAMRNIPGIHYQAVCDIMRDRLGGAFGRIRGTFGYNPNRYDDVEEMLNKETDLDAVIVSTPDFWHARHTNWSLEAGLHVFCEKMMAHTLEEARSMVLTAERTGKLCQINHQRRSNPRYRYTVDKLINGHRLCGTINNVNGQWNRSVGASQDIQVRESIIPDKKTLNKYGFANSHQFSNWRWYRDLSGGPISDLGAHQIDIFNWFLGGLPKSVMASGGRNYFTHREHSDNVMAIFEYDTPTHGSVRAFYQVLTTTSAGGGYYESFMGTEGTIQMSEQRQFTNIYRESTAPSWNGLVNRNVVRLTAAAVSAAAGDAVAAYESPPLEQYDLPGTFNKPVHQPHLENFFDSIRGLATLNCDARTAFETEAPIFWVNPAADSKEPIRFTDAHLRVGPQVISQI
jgi:predicted dehydrogenase